MPLYYYSTFSIVCIIYIIDNKYNILILSILSIL